MMGRGEWRLTVAAAALDYRWPVCAVAAGYQKYLWPRQLQRGFGGHLQPGRKKGATKAIPDRLG
jgi:hypothetical protein